MAGAIVACIAAACAAVACVPGCANGAGATASCAGAELVKKE
jgi:hypothetical protein